MIPTIFLLTSWAFSVAWVRHQQNLMPAKQPLQQSLENPNQQKLLFCHCSAYIKSHPNMLESFAICDCFRADIRGEKMAIFGGFNWVESGTLFWIEGKFSLETTKEKTHWAMFHPVFSSRSRAQANAGDTSDIALTEVVSDIRVYTYVIYIRVYIYIYYIYILFLSIPNIFCN